MSTVTTHTTTTRETPSGSNIGLCRFNTTSKAFEISDGSNWVVYNYDSFQTSALSNTGSIQFNGTDEYMQIPHDSAINNSTYTLSFWFKPTSSSGSANILAKRGGSSVGLFQVFLDSSNRIVYLGGSNLRTHSVAVTVNTWNHVAVVQRTGSDADIILNGNTQNFAEPAGNASETGDISVARSMNPGGPGYYPGYVDEVALFTSALSSSEVAALRDTTSSSNPLPADLSGLNPWAWYRMGDSDGGIGNTITDLGSGGNDGTLVNTDASNHKNDVPA